MRDHRLEATETITVKTLKWMYTVR